MSATIDQRVVEMQFDNAQFESKVQSTVEAIKELDRSMMLEHGDRGLRKVSASLQQIGNIGKASSDIVRNRFGFIGKMGSAVFSSLGSAAGRMMSALQSGFSSALSLVSSLAQGAQSAANVIKLGIGGAFTAVAGLAASGGVRRAMNLEHANFQLKGLLKNEKAVEKVMKDVNDSVDSTAYGLDEAAVVASQLVATGIKAGHEQGQLLDVLKGVAGVAAMGGAEYSRVGQIFTTVAGNGRLMGDQLLQMSSMGLNAAVTLRDYFTQVRHETGVTEESIRDMVSKGEIDFKTFAAAMSWAFGDHAKKANETFNGALSNTKAALSRIGAQFASPGLEYLRRVFLSLIPVINTVNKSMGPVVDLFKQISEDAVSNLEKTLSIFSTTDDKGATQLTFVDAFTKRFQSIAEFGSTAYKLLKPTFSAIGNAFSTDFLTIGEHLDKVFGSHSTSNLEIFSGALNDVTRVVTPLITYLGQLHNSGLDGFLSAIESAIPSLRNLQSKGAGILTAIGTEFVKAFPADSLRTVITSIGSGLSEAIDALASHAPALTDVHKIFGSFFSVFSAMGGVVSKGLAPFSSAINGLFDSLSNASPGVTSGLVDFFNNLASAIENAAPGLAAIQSVISETFSALFSALSDFLDPPDFSWLADLGSNFSSFATSLQANFPEFSKLKELFTSIFDVAKTAGGVLQSGFKGLSLALGGLFDYLGATNSGAIDWVIGFFNNLASTVKELNIGSTLESIGESIGNFFRNLATGNTSINSPFSAVIEFLKEAKRIADSSGIISALGDSIKRLFDSILAGPGNSVFEMFTNFLHEVAEFGKDIPGHILGAIGSLGDAIKKMVADSGMSFNDLLGVLNSFVAILASGAMTNMFRDVGKKIYDFINSPLTTMYKKLNFDLDGRLKGLANSFSMFAQSVTASVKTSAMLKVAGSILAMAVALTILASIDDAGLARGLAAVMLMLVAFTGVLERLTAAAKIGDLMALASIGPAISAIGTALLLMAIAMKVLSTMNPEDLIKSLLAMVATMAIMAAAMKSFSKLSGPLLRSSLAITTLAMTMLFLTAVIGILGHMKPQTLAKGILAMGASLIILIAALTYLSEIPAKKILSAGMALSIAAGAIGSIAFGLGMLGKMSTDSIAKSLVTLGASLIILSAAATYMADKRMIVGANNLSRVATAMLLLAPAIMLMSMANPIGLVVSLAALAAAMLLFSKQGKSAGLAVTNILKLSVGLLALSVALNVLGLSFVTFAIGVGALSQLSLEGIATAIVTLGSILLIIAAATNVLSDPKLFVGVGVIISTAGAIVLLAGAALALSMSNPVMIVVTMLALAAAIKIFSKIATSLGPASAAMYSLAAVLAVVGIAIMLIAGSIGILSYAATTLAASSGSIQMSISTMVSAFINAVAENLPTILEIMGTMFTMLGEAIMQGLASLGNWIVTIGSQILSAIQTLIGPIASAVSSVVSGISLGVQAALPVLMMTGGNVILALLAGIIVVLPPMMNQAATLLITAMNEIANIIRTRHQEMYEAGKNLFLAIIEAMADIFGNLATDLGSFISDIPAYISGEKELFASAGEESGNATKESFDHAVDGMPDSARQKASETVDGMADAFASSGGGKFAAAASGIAEEFTTSFDGSMDLTGPVQENIDSALAVVGDTGKFSSGGEAEGKALTDGLTSGASGMPRAAEEKANSAVSAARSKSGSASAGGHEVGSAFGSGMSAGMQSWIGPIAEKAAQMVRNAKSRAKAEQHSSSPSKDTMRYGGWFGEGYAIGIGSTVSLVGKAASSMVDSAKEPLSRLTSGDFWTQIDWDSQPVIRPVLDLSEYTDGIRRMQALNTSGSTVHAQWANRLSSASGSGGYYSANRSNSISINLNYGAGTSAAELVNEMANILQTKTLMEA